MNRSAVVALFALSLPALSACTPEDGTKDDTPAPGDSGAASTTEAYDGPTWHQDVQPMLNSHCTRCHYEGGLGPGDFTDLETVRALGPAMVGAMEAGEMPPAAADPTCREYKGSEHLNLPADDAATFAAWLDADTPEGDPTTAPEVVPLKDELENPDAVVMMESAYTPSFADPSNPGNEYRCFAIDPGELTGRYITSMAPIVGNNQMVHHIVLFTMPEEDLTESQRTPEGWNCIDDMGSETLDGMLTAWAPGMLPVEFPEGKGIQVEEGRVLVAQMHYFYNGPDTEGASDQSGYAFHLAPEDEPVAPVFMVPAGSFSFTIPAGSADYTFTDGFLNTYVDLTVLSMFPHMHQLGTRFNARILHEDGSETCLVDGQYSFDNQMTYQFTDPASFKKGDSVEFSCTWDNSAGDSAVRYGERTDEEMCFFFTFVTL